MTDKIIDWISSTRPSFWLHLVLSAAVIVLGVLIHQVQLLLVILTTWLSVECIQLQILLAERQREHQTQLDELSHKGEE